MSLGGTADWGREVEYCCDCWDPDMSGIMAGAPVSLRSLRKFERADDERSMRVRSVNRLFSAINASFLACRPSASDCLAASSPSSCPMYSIVRSVRLLLNEKVEFTFSSRSESSGGHFVPELATFFAA